MTASTGAEAIAAPFVRDREYRDQQPERLASFVDRSEAAIFPSCWSIGPQVIKTAGVCVGRSPARRMLSGPSSVTARACTQ